MDLRQPGAPAPLCPGDRVALVAPSGPVCPGDLAPAAAAVEALGLRPVVYPSCREQYGYLAGSDARRAADLQAAFADDSIRGILCVRGGYGAHRMLPLLDLGAIAKTPKVFCGYSDITALHIVFNQRCGFGTFHTPMPAQWSRRGLDAYTEGWLKKALFGDFAGPLQNPPGQPLTTLAGGRAQGILAGGNLSLAAAGVGTPYALIPDGRILFLEDIGEEPYRVDRMLTQLRGAGVLSRCAGIVLGAWTDCGPDPAQPPGAGLTLAQVFADLLGDLGIPVLAGLCCGHCMPTLSLPLGAAVTLDADGQTITVHKGGTR